MKRPLIFLLSISVLIGADAHAWGKKKKKGIISRAAGALLQPRPTAPRQIAPRQTSSILVPIAAGAAAGAVAGSVFADDEKTVVIVPAPNPTGYALTDAAHVMDLPAHSANRVRRLSMNEKLTIYEVIGGWARISAPGAPEEWVLMDYVSAAAQQ